MSVVIPYREFDTTKISLDPNVVTFKAGSKIVNFIYPNTNGWYFQTPKCSIPFDCYPTNFCISIPEQFYTKIKELESLVIQHAQTNTLSWFGENIEDVSSFFRSAIVEGKNGYLPFMRVNFKEDCEFYDHNNNLIDKSVVGKGSEVRLILKFTKVYINKKDTTDRSQTFKIISELCQLRLAKPTKVHETFDNETLEFLPDSEDENCTTSP